MKATLEFNLPEDQIEFEFATNGSKWWKVCWDMEQWLRGNIKHAPDSMSDDEYKTYELCREKLRQLIEDKGLNLDL